MYLKPFQLPLPDSMPRGPWSSSSHPCMLWWCSYSPPTGPGSFFTFQKLLSRNFVLIHVNLLSPLPDFLLIGLHWSWAWRKWYLNIDLLSWTSLSSRSLSHVILLSRSLKGSKVTLRKVMQDPDSLPRTMGQCVCLKQQYSDSCGANQGLLVITTTDCW